MIVIGITGGMASGKTTVARMFAGRGIRHVDADALVHQLMRSDKSTIDALANAFPNAVQEGNVNRSGLAKAAFSHPAGLATLEYILHPRVRAREIAAIRAGRCARARAIILDIPLLFETNADDLCDVVVAVDAPLAARRRRAFARPGMTDEKWYRLLSRQLLSHQRNRMADAVIHTGIGKAATRRMVRQLMHAWGIL